MLGITNVSNAPSIVLTNTSVSTWTALPTASTDDPNTDYDMYQQGYTYYASIPCNGISANTIAEVTFSEANAKSGNYASTCRTYADEIRVYSKVNTAITIPSIIVHSIVESYYTLDNAPTSGSTKAVTSGGVYSALTRSETVTITKNTTYIHSSSGWAQLDFDGRYVVGSMQWYPRALSSNTEYTIGTISKQAKYAQRHTGMSLYGVGVIVWVDGTSLKIYTTGAISDGDQFCLPIYYEVA